MARIYTPEFEKFWERVWTQYPADTKTLAWKIWCAGREQLVNETPPQRQPQLQRA
jgi:hypothetical protein